MRIALTSSTNLGIDDQIFDHFGHTPYFTIVDIQNQLVKKTTIVANPFADKHQPGEVPGFLAGLDVNLVIAGGMGARAKDMFTAQNIQVISGASGLISTVIENFLNGTLQHDAAYEPADKHTFHDH
jgi:predicted Fe-Mo cluster-binding NifX family protein